MKCGVALLATSLIATPVLQRGNLPLIPVFALRV
jgi:hypothetical protein